ncbi:hypothetical protein C1646_749407 [Rhizophagus diaphanus]|nr:hypothetical protein C1646_749407 [Rhizophagus diaphanus] [Rhizophagus sp. MUCL 43196]
MAFYEHEAKALGQSNPDLKDSDNSAKGDDINIIIKNTPKMPIPNTLLISQPELSDIVMTPVNPFVTTKNSQKEEINKSMCVTNDKQDKNQSLKGYEVSNLEEKKHIRNIIVYDISYTWSPEKISAELKLWNNPIKLLIK